MIQIHIQHSLNSAFGKMNLLLEKDLDEGDFISIFGESGAGKTTILKIIAGLIKPDYGYIKVNDKIWLDTDKKIILSPQKRNIGFVFQDYALFPNLTVRQNLAYGIKDKKNADKKIDEFLNLLSLTKLANAYPSTLSGGQSQRVALARAILKEPDLLLLDEPLCALDSNMRLVLQDELLKLYENFKLTTILVSHDIAEIYKLSNRIIELKNGTVVRDCLRKDYFSSLNSNQIKAMILDIQSGDEKVFLTVLIGSDISKIGIDKYEFEKKYPRLKNGQIINLKNLTL